MLQQEDRKGGQGLPSWATFTLHLPHGSVDHESVDGEWQNKPITEALPPLQRGQHRNNTASQKDVRDEFREYFMSTAGEVQWQY